MSLELLSVPYLKALLLSRRVSPTEASLRFSIPEGLFNEIYEQYKQRILDRDFTLSVIEELLRKNASPEEVAELINWMDFEELVRKYFGEHGFSVYRSLVIKSPRREIDLVAVKGDTVLCVDCKSWNKAISHSTGRVLCHKQAERCSHLSKLPSFKQRRIYPIIVQMRRGRTMFIEGIAVVPIVALKEFLLNLSYFIISGELKDVNALALR